jgi:uncharacterized protein (TIGR03000 family)
VRKLLIASVLALVGVGTSGERASAGEWTICGPWAQSAAFPMANPPGWYTNTYWYKWQYPWFAYYNYSHGPYANWMSGGGFATYGNYTGYPVTYAPWAGDAAAQQMLPPPPPKKDPVPAPKTEPAPGKVTINLPADATLLFNGTAATGTGGVRTFATPPLQQGTPYGYELTAEVMRDGKMERVTERVIVRAGETASITLTPGIVQTGAR